ncbi:MAG: hypothetical protein WBN39_07250, partial [Flavobacteriaceae bacterium]
MTRKFFLLAVTVVLMSNHSGLAQSDPTEDPYLWLEEVEGEKALEWVRGQNAISEKRITADPLFETLRQQYLEAANDKDKIIYPDLIGDHVYNLWQDEVNERGLWRRMSKADFLAQKTTWEVVLDLDVLSKKEGKMWVFAGATWLQPDNRICLLALADGGTDENLIREFNVETKSFVENGFAFPESKGDVSWVSADTVLVNRDFGEGTMTTSGYPRQLRILERGGILADAEVIFETAPSSVSARGFSFYEDDRWYVGVYNIFAYYNTELYFLDKGELQKLEQPKDANFAGFHKKQLLLSLQSDWTVNDVTYKKGTLVSYDLYANMEGELRIQTVYEPNEKSSYVSALGTKDFLVVNTMENVQNKLIKFTRENGAWAPEAIK